MLEGQCLKDIDHKSLVKKIILSRFLEKPVEKYEYYIESLKINSDFIKLTNWKCTKYNREIIKIIKFPKTTGNSGECNWPKNVLAEVTVSKDCYLINYRNEWFSKKIDMGKSRLRRFLENEKLTNENDTSIKDLLAKIRLINIRNSITYKILRGVIHFQKDFFVKNNDLFSLKVLSFSDVSKWVNYNFKNGLHVDNSRISRLINGKSIITKYGHEIELIKLFPSSRDIKKNILKRFFIWNV